MNALTFNEVTLNPVTQDDNQIWLTSAELAKALDYKSTDSVTKIFNRNKDEFTKKMTAVIETMADGIAGSKRRMSVRIFSLRGCYAIAMFARTSVAKAFRVWALDILERESGQPVATNNGELTAEQTLPLREAVSKLVTKLGILYPEGYKLVHQRFSVSHIKKLKPEQIPQAVEYIHNLQMQAYSGSLNIDAAIDNEMWRYVGLLKYMQLSEALREAQEASNKLHRAITGAQRHGGLVYDAFSEQQKIMSLGENGTNEAYEKAKDFVARQDALLNRCRTI